MPAPDLAPLLAHPPLTGSALRALVAGEVEAAAAGLIGCRIVSEAAELVIVETEAYHQREPACHGYGGHTPRAEKLRRPPGFSYVYLSYGIHKLVNVVTGSQEVASAVLLRGALRVGAAGAPPIAVPGPGRLGTALAVDLGDDGVDLFSGGSLRLEPADPAGGVTGQPLATGPRIGITKAVELPWRYALSGSPGV